MKQSPTQNEAEYESEEIRKLREQVAHAESHGQYNTAHHELLDIALKAKTKSPAKQEVKEK